MLKGIRHNCEHSKMYTNVFFINLSVFHKLMQQKVENGEFNKKK